MLLINQQKYILLLADSAKAKSVLDWQPSVSFEQLVQMMVAADLERVSKE